MKELVKKAEEVSKSASEKLQSDAFKVVLQSLLSSLDSKSSKIDVPQEIPQPNFQSGNGNGTSGVSELAKRCEISEHEIKNVIKISDKSVKLVYYLKDQTERFRQIVGSLITLLSHDVLFNEEHVKSIVLSATLKQSGIPDNGGNLAKNLKSRPDIFIFDSSANEYQLNTGFGLTISKKIFSKLAKSIQITDEDLKTT